MPEVLPAGGVRRVPGSHPGRPAKAGEHTATRHSWATLSKRSRAERAASIGDSGARSPSSNNAHPSPSCADLSLASARVVRC